MWGNIKQIFKDWKLLKRLLITFGILLLFRLGTQLTMPGVQIAEEGFGNDSFFNLLNLLSGGGLTTFSIFALGVSPYITSSIIMQLLSSDVVPIFSRWRKEGESGKVKTEKVTRIVAILIAVMQAIAIALAFQSNSYIIITAPFSTAGSITIFTIIMTGGTMLAIWLADLITSKGVGNGISLIIFVGIVASLPSQFIQQFDISTSEFQSASILNGVLEFIGIILLFLLIVMLVAFFYESERRIPLQQTGKNIKNDEKNIAPYLPIKVSVSGVIPVIFASAVVTLIPTIAQFLPETSNARATMIDIFSFENWYGILIYATLIFMFTFFYGHISIDAQQMSDSFKKNGTFILGVKPGEDTRKLIFSTVNYLCLIGGLYLSFIASLPYLLDLAGLTSTIPLGGTSLIIMVGVAIDTYKNIHARIIASGYKSDINKSKERTSQIIDNIEDKNNKGDLIL